MSTSHDSLPACQNPEMMSTTMLEGSNPKRVKIYIRVIPMWSPTIVLTSQYTVYFQCSMTLAANPSP
jgi:hypothetical protein